MSRESRVTGGGSESEVRHTPHLPTAYQCHHRLSPMNLLQPVHAVMQSMSRVWLHERSVVGLWELGETRRERLPVSSLRLRPGVRSSGVGSFWVLR